MRENPHRAGPNERDSSSDLLEAGAGFEFHRLGSPNLDRLLCPRVDTLPGRAFRDLEAPEADQLDLLVFLDALFDAFDDSVNRTFGSRF